MEISKETKLGLLNSELNNILHEEYLLKVRLAIAVEVDNREQVKRLEPIVEIIVRSIDSLKKRIKELEA
jgi:hypothetical protein